MLNCVAGANDRFGAVTGSRRIASLVPCPSSQLQESFAELQLRDAEANTSNTTRPVIAVAVVIPSLLVLCIVSALFIIRRRKRTGQPLFTWNRRKMETETSDSPTSTPRDQILYPPIHSLYKPLPSSPAVPPAKADVLPNSKFSVSLPSLKLGNRFSIGTSLGRRSSSKFNSSVRPSEPPPELPAGPSSTEPDLPLGDQLSRQLTNVSNHSDFSAGLAPQSEMGEDGLDSLVAASGVRMSGFFPFLSIDPVAPVPRSASPVPSSTVASRPTSFFAASFRHHQRDASESPTSERPSKRKSFRASLRHSQQTVDSASLEKKRRRRSSIQKSQHRIQTLLFGPRARPAVQKAAPELGQTPPSPTPSSSTNKSFESQRQTKGPRYPPVSYKGSKTLTSEPASPSPLRPLPTLSSSPSRDVFPEMAVVDTPPQLTLEELDEVSSSFPVSPEAQLRSLPTVPPLVSPDTPNFMQPTRSNPPSYTSYASLLPTSPSTPSTAGPITPPPSQISPRKLPTPYKAPEHSVSGRRLPVPPVTP